MPRLWFGLFGNPKNSHLIFSKGRNFDFSGGRKLHFGGGQKTKNSHLNFWGGVIFDECISLLRFLGNCNPHLNFPKAYFFWFLGGVQISISTPPPEFKCERARNLNVSSTKFKLGPFVWRNEIRPNLAEYSERLDADRAEIAVRISFQCFLLNL